MLSKLISQTLAIFNLRLEKTSRSPRENVLWPRGGDRPRTVLFEKDSLFHTRYEWAQSATEMEENDNALRRHRHFTLRQLVRSAQLAKGDVVEIGCWRGLSAYQIAEEIAAREEDTKFHIFDSFEGLSQLAAEDQEGRSLSPNAVEGLRKQFAATVERVESNLSEFSSFITTYPGWIPDRFGDVADVGFSFVHIDVDLYEPILDSLRFFYPRLCDGGIIVLDDYGFLQFPGAKAAADEFLQTLSPAPIFCHLPSGQAVMIKL
jgi:O-methyltransferase